ncbi:hypothetical protein FHS85_005361, partial [Rhodoligotrophos appendicifer]
CDRQFGQNGVGGMRKVLQHPHFGATRRWAAAASQNGLVHWSVVKVNSSGGGALEISLMSVTSPG